MAGSARSMSKSIFVGLRVASSNYFPAHSKNGKNVSQRCTINAFENVVTRNGESISHVVPLTAWGKLADVCAKSMSPGKEFHCEARFKPYEGRQFYNNQPVVMPDGTTLTSWKAGFSIVELRFGEESAKHVANEIQSGIRPPDWSMAGTAGYNAWREKLKMRNALVFDPTAPVFGYAKVFLPSGPGIGAYAPQAAAVPAAVPQTGAIEQAVVNATANPVAVGAALFQPAGVIQTAPAAVPVAPQAFIPVAAPVQTGTVQAGFAAPVGV